MHHIEVKAIGVLVIGRVFYFDVVIALVAHLCVLSGIQMHDRCPITHPVYHEALLLI